MNALIYKEYGKTGKKLSAIGFGGMRFVRENGKYDIEHCAEIVRKASELGVNYFDTAPHYCHDKSEFIMGEAFKAMPKPFYVSTKSGERDGAKLRQSLERSLKRLGLHKIHFFHIWCILTLEDYQSRMVKGGAYEAALRAKEEGLIDHIVFSTHCNGDEIETIIKDGCFEGVTLGYNILNFPYRQKGIRAAFAKGLGVAVMNPLGGGLIPQNAPLFSFIKEEKNEPVAEAALKFCVSHKEITTVLAGMSTLEQVIRNTRCGNVLRELSDERLKSLSQRLSASMDKLCTGCRYCEGCPKSLPIPKLMMAYNYKILQNKDNSRNNLKFHWGLHTGEAKNCIACGLCESKCTQHLPITMRLKEMAEWDV